MISQFAESKIESYLARTRVALRRLPEREIEDILRELRSHITELTTEEGGDLDSVLRTLGDPVSLARTYLAEHQMIQAECGGSPLVILQGLRHTTRSGFGRVTITALYAFGYINVLTLWSVAIEKLFAPSKAGLWYVDGHIRSLRLVNGVDGPAGGRELLGWWLVPICLISGWLLRLLVDRIAQWWIGRYRRLHPLEGF